MPKPSNRPNYVEATIRFCACKLFQCLPEDGPNVVRRRLALAKGDGDGRGADNQAVTFADRRAPLGPEALRLAIADEPLGLVGGEPLGENLMH